MTRDTNLINLIINFQIVTHLAVEHFNLASILSVSTNSSREQLLEDKTDFMEVSSPSDTYHILYNHDTSKVSTTLLTQMMPPSVTLLVVRCVIPFVLIIQQREIKLCLSVCLSAVFRYQHFCRSFTNHEDIIELQHEISNNVVCATSNDSD